MNPASVLDSFISDPTINGQHVDIDKQFGGQCWDLTELFAERCGVPKATSPRPWALPLGTYGYAKEAWTQYDQSPHMQKYFTKIPAGQQQKGDITVYDGHGTYVEGHIAVSLGGSAVFEENADPDGSPAHVYPTRSSTYLLGALRIKGGSMATITTEAVVALCIAMTGRQPQTDEEKQYINKEATQANLDGLITYWVAKSRVPELEAAVADRDKKIQALIDQSGTTRTSVLEYINNNLK